MSDAGRRNLVQNIRVYRDRWLFVVSIVEGVLLAAIVGGAIWLFGRL